MRVNRRSHSRIPIAISSCLLGESVRYNGGHKRSVFCADTLSLYFEYLPFCPEVAIGMGVPRESIRLVGDWDAPNAVGTKTESLDVTKALVGYADDVRDQIKDCRGYIFMKDSPSCGLYSTKVYNSKMGLHPKKRSGLYAARIRESFPLIPMEESGRLNDPELRENFIARVFAFDDWKSNVHSQPSAKKLVAFHSRYKYWVMAYSQALYKKLGQMVASAGVGDINELCHAYIHDLMDGTRKPPTRTGHVNVLFHLVGYLRETVPGGIRQDLTQAIDEYRRALVPLAVPMKLMEHYLENYASDYVRRQSYINPYPYELGLRNAI